ncbi:NBS-LRR resistance-like protein [Trifolium medium]|uniref:NBS-LRR resistance-like protein n=1 Tax=Trifolium medium TaxID=97028 RepID=A0A392MGI1_9FABA|nr:NBS-LRR resistance-like protein [Trifolium medium]
MEELPEIKETIENLKVLILDKTAIKELPSSLHRLAGLEALSLQSCTKLKNIPSSIGNLSKLIKLNLANCVSLETFPSSIFKLKLTRLDFKGCSMLWTFPEISNDIGRLSSLTELSLQGSSIVNLPESMAQLSSLKSLNISDCTLLECVPKLPPNLNQFLAFDCPSIKRMVLNSRSASKKGTFQFHLTNNQELDATSWSNIGDEACIKITDDAYRSVFFCFSGSAVPCWFHYYCKGNSVTMKKDSPNVCSKNRLTGFALCVVLGREDMDDTRTGYTRFAYNFGFISDGDIHCSYNSMPENYLNWSCRDRFLNHDHTFLWKHRFDLERIGNTLFHAQNFTFEILVDDLGRLSCDSTTTVKECGICPLYTKGNDDDDDDDEDD